MLQNYSDLDVLKIEINRILSIEDVDKRIQGGGR